MLRNIVYRDKDIEVIMVVARGNQITCVSVHAYVGHFSGIRTTKSLVRCEFSSWMTAQLLSCVLVVCWTHVREEGSVSDEMQVSINKAIRKELSTSGAGIREIDWTKQVPTELGQAEQR